VTVESAPSRFSNPVSVVFAIGDGERLKLSNYANNMCFPWSQPERAFRKEVGRTALITGSVVVYFFLMRRRSGVPVNPYVSRS
jgi:hypothetical protein